MPYHFLDFELDPSRYQLRRAGAELKVPPRIFDLILLLVRHRDRPVPKSEILATIWHGRTVTEASLTHAIATARKALGDTPSAQSIIKTVHGRGYWWVAETREVPDRARVLGFGALPLVGRSSALDAIGRALSQSSSFRGSCVLLFGEAGVGKTRLSEELATRASEQGFTVLRAACLEHEGAPVGYPWVQVLRSCIANLQRAGGSAEVVDAIEHLTTIFSELGESRDVNPNLHSTRVTHAFSIAESIWRVLSMGARFSPHLIVIDDLHRADELSLTLLRLVVRRLGHDRLMIIGCAREAGPHSARIKSSLAELAQQPHVQTIALEALLRSDMPRLLERLHLEPTPVLCDALFDRSSGNPFFLSHLIASVSHSHGPDSSIDIQELVSLLPVSIRDAILRLVQEIPDCSAELLEVAAVAGRSFSPLLLADVARVSVQDVLAMLKPAEDVGLVEGDPHAPGGFRFRHVIARDVIYQALSRPDRANAHKQIAHKLRSEGELNASSVAHHMRCAFPLVDGDEVAATTLMAASHASARSAFSEAVNECRSALCLSGLEPSLSPARRCELLLTEAAARLRSGQREEGRTGLRQAASLARSQGLVAQLADAALAIAPGFFAIETGVVDTELIETLQHALDMLPQEDSVVRVRLLGNLAAALYWSRRRDRIPTILEEVTAMVERMASDEALAYSLAAHFVGLWSPASLERRKERADDLLRLAESNGDDDLRLMSRVFRIATFLELGDFGRSRREIKALEAAARALRNPHVQWYPPMYRAMLEITQGRFDRAKVNMKQFVELGTRFDDANVVQTFLLQSAEIAWQTECPARIIPNVEANVQENPALKEWECALAFLLARAGRLEDARLLASRLIGELEGELLGRMNVAIGLAALAECCWLIDDPDLASAIEPMILELGSRVIVAGYGILCWGSTSRGLGHVAATLRRWDDAEAHYIEALKMEQAIGATPWIARSSAAFSRVLEQRGRRGDVTRAQRLRRQAEALARDLNLSPLDRLSR